jgi:hypothetical protein
MGESALVMTRRQAIACLGTAGLGLAAASPRTASGPLADGSLYKVVYDGREAEGLAFGAHFAAAGLASVTVADDPTWLWFDDLHHRWRGAGVAGLTTPAVALSLKLMAELAGLRAVIWGRHWIDPSQASHVLAPTDPARSNHVSGQREDRAREMVSWPARRNLASGRGRTGEL